MASRFLSPAYEVMLSAASPGINFLRGVAGYQDPIGTPAMQDRMLELEAQKGPSGSIGYEDYGLPVSSEGGRFTGGLPNLLLSNPIDFGLAGSVGRYGYSPEGRTDLKYDFTPDEETGSTGNAILDFINKGGIKNYISESKGLPFALPDLSLGAPTFNFNRNNTTEPDLNNSALARRLMTQPGLDKFTGINKGVYDPYGIKVEDGRFSYDMNKTSLADYQKPKNRFTGMDTSYGVANEEDDEQVDSLTGEKKSNGIMDMVMSFLVPGYNFIKNLGSGQPYEQFSPGTTIRNGIVSVAGVNTPYSAFGGDFYNPNTGLNRFDRARQRFEQTGKTTDLFKSSRTGKEFFDKLRAKKEAERLKTVSQQNKEVADRGGGYQPTTTAQNTARTESRVSGGKTRAYGL